jgi:hypothetical protein
MSAQHRNLATDPMPALKTSGSGQRISLFDEAIKATAMPIKTAKLRVRVFSAFL